MIVLHAGEYYLVITGFEAIRQFASDPEDGTYPVIALRESIDRAADGVTWDALALLPSGPRWFRVGFYLASHRNVSATLVRGAT